MIDDCWRVIQMYSLGDPCINSRGIWTGTSITPRYNTSLILIEMHLDASSMLLHIIMFNIINDVVEIDRKLANISEDLDELCPPFIPGNERPTAVSLARILALANSAQHVIPEHNSLGPTKNLATLMHRRILGWWKYTMEHQKQQSNWDVLWPLIICSVSF